MWYDRFHSSPGDIWEQAMSTGQNVNGKGSKCQIGEPSLTVHNANRELIEFPLIERDSLLYTPRYNFNYPSPKSSATVASSACAQTANGKWSVSRPIIDRVHRPVCGYTDHTVIELLLGRNKL